jgi:FAD-dependent urate hydroxylase
MKTKEVVVVGAGPYGLSTAANLQAAGVEPYVIGQPMAFWKQNMPTGMLLRSRVEASNIAAGKRLSIFAYEKAIGRKLPEPLPADDFIAYGEWFQAQAFPNLDTRMVRAISQDGSAFTVAFEDGDKLQTKRVVLAIGIGPFRTKPEVFDAIPTELAHHSSDLTDPSRYRGQRVAVVGKGQSALEYAALLHEAGAEVQILTRGDDIKFRPFAWRKHLFRTLTPGPLRPLSYRILPPTDLGDIKTARKIAHPEQFRRQSPEVQLSLLKDCMKPVGAYWLPDRLTKVRVRTRVHVTQACAAGDRLKLELSDGTSDMVDRALLATGYRIDMARFPILDPELRRAVQANADGYPVLTTGLETTVKGLYMAGVVGEKTLGPTLRFVTGTSNAGPRVAEAIAGRRR